MVVNHCIHSYSGKFDPINCHEIRVSPARGHAYQMTSRGSQNGIAQDKTEHCSLRDVELKMSVSITRVELIFIRIGRIYVKWEHSPMEPGFL